MINKFKTWLKKFKKDKNESLEDSSVDIDLDAQIPDEEDIDVILPEDEADHPPAQVLTREALESEASEDEAQLPEQEDLEYPDSDHTSEIDISALGTSEDENDQAQADATGEIQVQDHTSEQDVPIDLSAKLSFRDRVEITGQKIKDKVSRINFRKFKDFKFSTLLPKEGAAPNQSLSQKLKSHYNITVPASLEKFEKKLKKFPWQNLHNEVFYPKNRTAIHKGFLILLLALTPYYFGKGLGLLLKGKPDYKNLNDSVAININKENELTTAHLVEIKNAKLFKTEMVKTDPRVTPKANTPEVCKDATKKSNLPIKLLNTIVLQDSVKSIASVQIRNQDLNDVRIGDKIDDMAKVDRINRLGIIVKNLKDGTCESIDNNELNGRGASPIAVLDKKASKTFIANKKIEGIENDGNTFKIKKDFLKEKMKNISDVLTQARGIQMTNPDGSMSFKIVDVEPGGIFSYLGIQNNDIITHINGKKINDLNEVMGLFGKITGLSNLKITVTRGGEEVPLDYKLQ